ncbi:hybrid sensor histidine kinase/response regulator [Bryobacter aggregatus]|uniref:hybrid sensor histidine kinase/response regulator n=1 Tax=Bryobacter aggregatus TaxID=360054 RepID=UPI00068A5D0D|nr:ATP-binding protein [Bryobacter aggregatus]
MSSENLELEQQRRKLETLGRLAGNVVHDFNNLLMVIEGYTRMLLEEPNLSENAQESAQEILRASERASALTRQLLAFSRKKSVERKGVDINAQLTQMRNMLTRLLGETVRLEYELSAEPCLIYANHSQMEQVLLNLIVNARDAMPVGGRILVRTLVAAGRVRLVVEDTGTGIPPELLPRIFEPFFTTKEASKGTGIGLALVHEIVREWGGTIEANSRPNEGTSFHIELATFDDPSLAKQELVQPKPKLGTILLVEDEDGVRSLIRRVLEQRHYEVLEAATEEGGLELARGRRKIDLLVTDLDLKRGEGRNLASLVRVIHPGIKVVFISGYVNEAGGEGALTLQKPFSPNTLVLAVQGLLKTA